METPQQERTPRGTKQNRAAEMALALVLAAGMSLAWPAGLPPFSAATLEVFGFFSLLAFGNRLLRIGEPTKWEPQVSARQPLLLALGLATGAWAQSLPVPHAWAVVIGFVPSAILLFLFIEPWHRLLPIKDAERAKQPEEDQ